MQDRTGRIFFLICLLIVTAMAGGVLLLYRSSAQTMWRHRPVPAAIPAAVPPAGKNLAHSSFGSAGAPPVGAVTAGDHVPSSPGDKERFLEALEVAQERIRDISVRVNVRRYDVDRGTGGRAETPYYIRARYVMAGEPHGKGRVEIDQVWPAIVGGELADAPGGETASYAFDGTMATSVRHDPGMEGPARQQTVSRRRFDADDIFAVQIGMPLVAAYYNDTGLAQYLRNCQSWDLIPLGGDEYLVRENVIAPGGAEPQGSRDITVDMARNAAVTDVDYVLMGTRVAEFKNIALKDAGDGIWLPVSAEYEDYTEVGYALTLEFVEVAANQDPPEETFRIALEPGRQVTNKIMGVKYVQSDKWGLGRLFRRMRYLAKYIQRLATGQSAGPTSAGGAADGAGLMWQDGVLAAVALSAMGAMLFVLVRRRRRRRARRATTPAQGA